MAAVESWAATHAVQTPPVCRTFSPASAPALSSSSTGPLPLAQVAVDPRFFDPATAEVFQAFSLYYLRRNIAETRGLALQPATPALSRSSSISSVRTNSSSSAISPSSKKNRYFGISFHHQENSLV